MALYIMTLYLDRMSSRKLPSKTEQDKTLFHFRSYYMVYEIFYDLG